MQGDMTDDGLGDSRLYAFPFRGSVSWGRGMTLRDYFAGQALIGFAVMAYGYADAMLKARNA
jgi:hypothetical protein